jgi:hypothetical protein
VNVLLVAARPAWPPHTGDRVRLGMWMEALRGRANVVLVAPDADDAGVPAHVTFIAARRSIVRMLLACAQAVYERLPLHTVLFARWNWRRAMNEAVTRSGPFDVTIVLLSRTLVWVRPGVTSNRTILDAVDSLTASLEERARASSWLLRRFWRSEAVRMERLEKRLASGCERVIVVARDEAERFGPEAATIPMGVEISDMPETDRVFEVGFWGRLPFFANAEAVGRLVNEIWPEIRRLRPRASLLIAGAEAPRWIRALHGRDGVTIMSPMTDRPRVLRQVKVALFPITFGSGQSMKTLEAAEASCAVVGTSKAFRGIPHLAEAAIVLDDMSRMAPATVALLEQDERLRAMGRRLRDAVVASHSRVQCEEQLAGMVTKGARQ